MNKKICLFNIISILAVMALIVGCGGGGTSINPAGTGDTDGNYTTPTFTPAAAFFDLEGTVFESDGEIPVKGAFVLFSSYGDSQKYNAVTGEEGTFKFLNLPAGSSRVEVWRDNSSYIANPDMPEGAVNVELNQEGINLNVILTQVDPTATPTPVSSVTPQFSPTPSPTSETGIGVIISR